MKYSLYFLFFMAFLGFIYNLFLYVRVSQSKESSNLKIDGCIWPFLNSICGSFFLFAMVNFF